jgi:hypothetical protein
MNGCRIRQSVRARAQNRCEYCQTFEWLSGLDFLFITQRLYHTRAPGAVRGHKSARQRHQHDPRQQQRQP